MKKSRSFASSVSWKTCVPEMNRISLRNKSASGHSSTKKRKERGHEVNPVSVVLKRKEKESNNSCTGRGKRGKKLKYLNIRNALSSSLSSGEGIWKIKKLRGS